VKVQKSAKKLASANSEDVHWNSLHGYRIIEFFTVFTAYPNLLFVVSANKISNLKKLEIEVSVLSFYFVAVAEEI